MKLNLNELETVIEFIDGDNNPIICAASKLLFELVTEPIQMGVFETNNKLIDYDMTNASKSDLLKGLEFLRETGADFKRDIYTLNL